VARGLLKEMGKSNKIEIERRKEIIAWKKETIFVNYMEKGGV